MNTLTEPQVRLIASARNRVEAEAVRQLYAMAECDGVRLAIGFPDLHAGQRTANGTAVVTEGILYPHLIGEDIGCGMGLFKTNLVARNVEPDRWSSVRFNLEHPWEEYVSEYLTEHALASTEFDTEMGTIGGGNHFAELQVVEDVFDEDALRRFGLGGKQVVLLVHSGSRGVGKLTLRNHMTARFERGAKVDSFVAEDYLRNHEFALRWAKANRELIAHRFAAALGARARLVWDGCHNSITPVKARAARKAFGSGGVLWVHRKGAVATRGKPVVIPGSRGSLSYLVRPVGTPADHAWSLAHGAGRRLGRTAARVRMRKRFAARHLARTPLGGRVICEERDLLYEEAPHAYKNIEDVIRDLVDAGLVSVIATLRPLLTYKTRKQRR